MRRAFVPCAPSAGSPLTETMPAVSRAGSKVRCGGQARSAKALARRARSGRVSSISKRPREGVWRRVRVCVRSSELCRGGRTVSELECALRGRLSVDLCDNGRVSAGRREH